MHMYEPTLIMLMIKGTSRHEIRRHVKNNLNVSPVRQMTHLKLRVNLPLSASLHS